MKRRRSELIIVMEVLKNKNLYNMLLGNIIGNRFCVSESEVEVRYLVKFMMVSIGIKKWFFFCFFILNLYIKMIKIFLKSLNII